MAPFVMAPRAQPAASLPFRNPDLPIEQRVDDLVARLTLDEKVSLMIDRAQPVERLGIEAFPWWNEGLHGVARAGRATVFPQAIGLAATWDAPLLQRIAGAIGDEARAKHNLAESRGQHHLYQGLTFWSPNINIFRDPRWGRGQETYGEDPFLTGTMAVAFVRGMQGDDPRYLKTIATPKHFAVHSGPEPRRHTFDAHISDVDLYDTYLPAFRAAVVDGGAGSVMCAYNSVRGLPACGNGPLLGDVLRGAWNFKGYVVSDCGAIDDIYRTHKTRATAPEAAALALKAGTDLECGSGAWSPGSPDTYLKLADAARSGLVSERDIDTALRRLLRAQMRLGIYDPPDRVPFSRLTYADVVDSPAHQALALDAARESIVLLKNEHDTLPLPHDLRSIAVIGPNADDAEVLLGNYNGTPVQSVTIRQGIAAAVAPSTRVLYARGAPLADGLPEYETIPAAVLSTETSSGRVQGLSGAVYRGHFDGTPVATRVDREIDFDWADRPPAPGLGEVFSVRWTGDITVPATGDYTLGFRGATSFRVMIDNYDVARGRSDHEPALVTGKVTLLARRRYPIRVEYEHEKYDAVGRLLWEKTGPKPNELPDAIAAARAADAVVLVLGLSSRLEGEEMHVGVAGFSGGDRTSLDLPASQEMLMEQVVAAAGSKPVVLVLLSGSALAINWASQHVPAIVDAWYPGQEAGTAVADVLFGRTSPAGRLPITFYRSVDQLPPFDDYAMKGRTYRYFTGEPLYSFGYGLSYARFEYSHLRVPDHVTAGDPVAVSVDVRNAGAMRADEVVELYVTHDGTALPAPLRALEAFARVSLDPGERRTVTLPLTDRSLSLVTTNGDRVDEPGRVTVFVGGRQPRADDLRSSPVDMLHATITVVGARKMLAR